MATIPLTFRVSPIPDSFDGDLNAYAQALVDRLRAEGDVIAQGTVLPTSDVGPFWKTDTREWYGWNASTGTYVAQSIDASSRGFIAQVAPGPDQNQFVFWIELDGTGRAKAIKYFSGGAWNDVYDDRFAQYYTQSQVNSLIAGSGGGTSSSVFPVEAATSAGQTVVADGSFTKVVLDGKTVDPENVFNVGTYEYVAPANGTYRVNAWAQVDNGTAQASTMTVLLAPFKNGVQQGAPGGAAVASPPGSRWFPSVVAKFVEMATNDVLDLRMAPLDAVGTGNVTITHVRMTVDKIA